MGGKGSGGRRVGAGAKPKDAAIRALDGNASHRGKVLPHPSAPAAPPPVTVAAADIIVDEAHAPDTLTIDERRVWLELAPFALENGTLTKAKASFFVLFCKNIVLERALRLTEPASPNWGRVHRCLEAGYGDFGLRSFGKVSGETGAKPAADPIKDKYFGSR